MNDLKEFLENLGLGQYQSVFSKNDVDLPTLGHLTDQDLIELGLSLGHRRKLKAALSDLAPELEKALRDTSPLEFQNAGERRQLTVMFCDLVGSTQLSSQLDPEDLRKVMQQYHAAASQTIAGHGGYVAKLLGDGILAYFGFPNANENDCERAVRAGLAVIDAVGEIVPSAGDASKLLEVRVGIATGLVVIGELTGATVTDADAVIGETPNLAARLQSLADPGSVMISDETHELVGGVFEYRSIGQKHVAGFPKPVSVWRVLHEVRASNRFDLLRGQRMTDLVGRREETDLLRRRWASAQSGKGSVVVISGDAGIGKSRIAQALRENIAKDAPSRLQYQCSQFHIGTAFTPVIRHFEHAAGFAHDDSAGVRADKLNSLLGDGENEVIAALLRLRSARAIAEIEPDPELRRERVLEALIAHIERRSTAGPMLVIFEDLHWADDSTLEFINKLVEVAARLPILIVATTRPGLDVSWLGDPHVSFVMLNRLDHQGIRALIHAVTNGLSLPDDVLTQIEQRTDGVPLFVEELTRSILQSGLLEMREDRLVAAGELLPGAIPMTLQDTLTARLDRMSTAKETAQLGAVIGRRFSFSLIAAVSTAGPDALTAALKMLEDEGLLSKSGAGSDLAYEFRHALIRDAAYESLLKSTRAELHGRFARCLLRDFSELAETEPAIVAHHLTEAGLNDLAIDNWIAAGERSVETSGYVEALKNLAKALTLLRTAETDPSRKGREIAVLLAMGPCQVQVLGPASDEMLETYATAVHLCEKHGTLEQRFKALWGLWFYHFMLGDVLRMRDLADQLIPLARELGDEALELEGHHCEWAALSLLGDLEGALTSTEIGIEKYRQDQHHWMTFHYGGHDPGLCAHSLNAVNLCLLGYPDRAKTVMSDALNFADRLNHSYSLLETKFCALTVMLLCSDHAGIRQHAGELIELTDANRLPSEARALANGFLGWVQTETGEVASGLSLMKASVSDWQAFWGAWCFPLDAAYAAALTDQGECEAALGILDAATEVGGSTGGHWWDAEFLRVRGKALLGLQSSDTSEVRTSLDAALAAARKREARLFELRAATDLANLILDEGDASAAKVLLEPVVQSMPQGHDLLDIIVAHKTLGRCLNDHSRTE